MKKLLILPFLLSSFPLLSTADESKPLVFTVIPSEKSKPENNDGKPSIEITIRNASPEEAQRIMEAVSQALNPGKLEEPAKGLKEAQQALEETLDEQLKKVDQLRRKLVDLVQSPEFLELSVESVLEKAQVKLAEFEAMRDLTEIQIKKLTELAAEELVTYAAGLELPENQVSKSLQKHQEALANRTRLIASGLGPIHPEVRAQEALAQASMEQAQQEAHALKEVLETRLKLVDRQLQRMNEMIDAQKKSAAEHSKTQAAYQETKAAYEKAKAELEALKARKAGESDE